MKHANETSLSVMWMTPVAEWDSYVVSLEVSELPIVKKGLAKEAKEFTFTDLIPGRKYTAIITTISGTLSNWTSVEGRTGIILSNCFNLYFCQPLTIFFFCFAVNSINSVSKFQKS